MSRASPRSLLVFAAVGMATLTISGCPNEPPAPSPPAPSPRPSPVDAVASVYEKYASDPAHFDRLPHVSRFFVQDGRRIDGECARGERTCAGDRFACLDEIPTKPGRVDGVTLDGEQPGVSASVKVKLTMGGKAAEPVVDVVWEDGAWKVDQVRCLAVADR